MSSILTNNSAMVALQTLKGINKNLGEVQSQISTGKAVGSAKDNSAVWAISKVMESDVAGFKAISSSLSLGESTVSVARQAAETVTDLLTQMKDKIVAGTSDNVDGAKLQEDVVALREQITSVVSAAQFNGKNLVNGAGGDMSVLSSLDRNGTGGVNTSNIVVSEQNLSTGSYAAKDVYGTTTGVSGAGDTFGMSIDDGATGNIVFAEGAGFATGDTFSITVGDKTASYTVSASDAAAGTSADIVAVGMKTAIDALGMNVDIDYDSGTAGTLVLSNNTGNDITVSGNYTNAAAGGLGALQGIDVTTPTGATAAVDTLETLINTSISAAASFGSAQGRIETQADFVSGLSDSLKSGIGSLVDANMEEASARLQALQVQQQLGTQSLSIANQAPQQLLSLFR